MKLRKLRKKLENKKWLEKKYERLCSKAQTWHDFKEYHCEYFFVGSEKAEYNRRKYDKNMHRIERQINFIKSLLKIKN